MATTTYSALRYPVGTDATTLATYFQNLANDVDQKVEVRVADNTSRNALTKYDGMRVYVTSTRRVFRYDLTNSRWDFVSGPWYAWTPSLTTVAGAAVTASPLTTDAAYTVMDSRCHFIAEMQFNGTINGQTGQLVLQMPAGMVQRSTLQFQTAMTASLYTPHTGEHWVGIGKVVTGTYIQPHFQVSNTNAALTGLRNATGAGVTGSGVPAISGGYPLEAGAYLAVWGSFELSSWSAL